MAAFLLAVGPCLPGLAYSINDKSSITSGAKHLYTFDWLYGFVTSIFIYTVSSYIWKPANQIIPHTVYGIPQTPDDEEAYEEAYDEKVLRKGSLVGNGKSFANAGGIDSMGSAMHFRKSVDETAKESIEVRKASRASQGGQGPYPPGYVPEHLRGVDPAVLNEKM